MRDVDVWIRLFRSVAASAPTDPPRAHSTPIEALLLAWTGASTPPALRQHAAPDEVLWHALCARHGAPACVTLACEGPLAPEIGAQGIETWHATELCALHALAWFAAPRGTDAIWRRVRSAAAWCLDEVQPDHATDRPWGAHVFAMLGCGGDERAVLYADGLVHHAVLSRGVPSETTAKILADAARWLDERGRQAGDDAA